MTTLPDRTEAALLVIDVQNGVMKSAHARESVIGQIARLVERARREGVAVIWVQHHSESLVRGEEPWRIVPELQPREGEAQVYKAWGDAFEDTDLETVLGGLRAGRLFIVGAQTDACIRSTLHGAFTRGYDVTLIADAHSTEDLSAWGAPPPAQVIRHTNLYWRFHAAPGRSAATFDAAEVDFGVSRPPAA